MMGLNFMIKLLFYISWSLCKELVAVHIDIFQSISLIAHNQLYLIMGSLIFNSVSCLDIIHLKRGDLLQEFLYFVL